MWEGRRLGARIGSQASDHTAGSLPATATYTIASAWRRHRLRHGESDSSATYRTKRARPSSSLYQCGAWPSPWAWSTTTAWPYCESARAGAGVLRQDRHGARPGRGALALDPRRGALERDAREPHQRGGVALGE